MAAAIVATFVLLGAFVVVLGWTGFSIYAMVKWIGSAPDEANPVVIVLLFVGVVSLIVTAFLAGLALVGRSMTPRKRDRDRDPTAEIHGL